MWLSSSEFCSCVSTGRCQMRISHRSSRTYNSSPSDLRPDKRWFCVQKQLQEQTQPAACSLILTAQCCRGKQGGPGSQMLLDQAGETLETQVAYWSAYVKLRGKEHIVMYGNCPKNNSFLVHLCKQTTDTESLGTTNTRHIPAYKHMHRNCMLPNSASLQSR